MENIIRIYTDGAASGNPGPSGLGIVLLFGSKKKEIARGYRLSTNNRMELLAVIIALETLKTTEYPVEVYSDSKYVVDAINLGWLFSWEKKQFDKKANPDLWIRFLPLYRKYKPRFIWVKGHANNVYNNRCDELAVAAYKQKDLEIDAVFERSHSASKGSMSL
jgi:ribonuclease HI